MAYMKIPSQYKVIIEDGEDGYLVASVPELPGCYTQGKTYEELMEQVKDAIALCLEHAEESPSYRAKIAERAEEGSVIGMTVVTV